MWGFSVFLVQLVYARQQECDPECKRWRQRGSRSMIKFFFLNQKVYRQAQVDSRNKFQEGRMQKKKKKEKETGLKIWHVATLTNWHGVSGKRAGLQGRAGRVETGEKTVKWSPKGLVEWCKMSVKGLGGPERWQAMTVYIVNWVLVEQNKKFWWCHLGL